MCRNLNAILDLHYFPGLSYCFHENLSAKTSYNYQNIYTKFQRPISTREKFHILMSAHEYVVDQQSIQTVKMQLCGRYSTVPGWNRQHTSEGKCPEEKPPQLGNRTPIKPFRAQKKASEYFWCFGLHLTNVVQQYSQKEVESRDVPAVKHRLQRKTSTTTTLVVGFVVDRIANPVFHPLANFAVLHTC